MKSPLRLERDSFLMAYATHRVMPFVTHWHPSVEIVYCVDGSFSIQSEDAVYQMQKGDIIVIGCCKSHNFNSVVCPISYYSMVFDPGILHFLAATEQFSFKLPERHSAGWPEELREEVKSYILDIYREYIQRKCGYRMAVVSMLLKIQALLIRAFPECLELDYRQIGNKGAEILRYMSEHYLEPITLGSCADSMNFGRSYFSHLFKKETGESFHETLLRLRLSKAEWLLLYTSEPIAAVVDKSGFQNEKTFYRVFRKFYGMSPIEFRRTALEDYRDDYTEGG